MNVKPRVAIASKSECLVRGAEVGFEVSNGGIVPRRLVVELSLNCMDCIGFSCFRFAFCFGFPASVVCAGSCGKAERPPETRHGCAVFFDRLRLCCKNPSIVLEFAASSSLYDDAPIHATRGHPIARRLERRRRASAGEVVPAGGTRIAPARPPLHEPGA